MSMAARCHAEQRRRGVGTDGAAGEKPVLAADGYVPQRAFGDVVVDGEETVADKTRQRLPMPQGVGESLAHQALRQHLGMFVEQPSMERGQLRQRLSLTKL